MAAPRGLVGKNWWRNSSEKLGEHVLGFRHLAVKEDAELFAYQ
jgi:hypothetical protein